MSLFQTSLERMGVGAAVTAFKQIVEVDGPASKALKMLAAWEKAHEKFFKEFRDKLTDTYAQMPWGG
jgi:hypothetical protein